MSDLTDKSAHALLPIVPESIGQLASQTKIVRPKGFDFHQFIWVTDGSGIFTADNKTVCLSKGQGFFTRKFIPHAYQSDGDVFSTRWVTFTGAEPLLEYFDIGNHLIFDVPDFLDYTTDRLSELVISTSSKALRAAHGYLWITELLDAIVNFPDTPPQRIIQFLENNYGKYLTLEQIAAFAGIDKFTLCRTFQRETGETVMQTLKKIRTAKAKQFLRYSTYSIEEIGNLCGYESPSYFIKVFRETVGCTPNHYRHKWQR